MFLYYCQCLQQQFFYSTDSLQLIPQVPSNFFAHSHQHVVNNYKCTQYIQYIYIYIYIHIQYIVVPTTSQKFCGLFPCFCFDNYFVMFCLTLYQSTQYHQESISFSVYMDYFYGLWYGYQVILKNLLTLWFCLIYHSEYF